MFEFGRFLDNRTITDTAKAIKIVKTKPRITYGIQLLKVWIPGSIGTKGIEGIAGSTGTKGVDFRVQL